MSAVIGGYSEVWYTRPQDVMALADLTYREEYLIKDYLGIDREQPLTIKEMSKVHGVTTNRIKGALEPAFEKMRVAYAKLKEQE